MRKTLRSRVILALLAAVSFDGVFAQNIGISTNALNPNVKAVLDLDVSNAALSPKRGMLIPRMTRAEKYAIPVFTAPEADGLWVYQTDDSTSYTPQTAHGYWYYDGTTNKWSRWSAGNGWILTGNPAVATNYLGTSTAESFQMRTIFPYTVDTPQVVIAGTNQFVGIKVPPTPGPLERLEVNGGMRVFSATTPGSAGNQSGTIRFDNTLVAPVRGHYGNIDNTVTGWRRLENAEVRVTAGGDYPADTSTCGTTGQSVVGIWNSGFTSTNNNTPLPTNGAGSGRGFRGQYLYTWNQLDSAGICAGPITGISFYFVQDEIISPLCAVNMEVRIEAATAGLASTGFATGVFWDNPAQAGVVRGTYFNITPSIGWLYLPLTTPYNLAFGQSIVVDLSWIRSNQAGISPKVQVQTTQMAMNCSRTFAHPTSPSNGNLLDDSPLTPAGTAPVSTHTRPVTRFNAQVKQPSFTQKTSSYLRYGGALMVDSQATANTWAATNYRGNGTARARVAVYDGNLRLSDHVFDSYFEGAPKAEDAESAKGFAYIGLPELKNYLETERHLPNMPSRTDWSEKGVPSIGELQTGLWETLETQALQIGELEHDLHALEQVAFGTVQPSEIDKAVLEINASPRLTEAQKLHLIQALRDRANANQPTH